MQGRQLRSQYRYHWKLLVHGIIFHSADHLARHIWHAESPVPAKSFYAEKLFAQVDRLAGSRTFLCRFQNFHYNEIVAQ